MQPTRISMTDFTYLQLENCVPPGSSGATIMGIRKLFCDIVYRRKLGNDAGVSKAQAQGIINEMKAFYPEWLMLTIDHVKVLCGGVRHATAFK